MYLLKQFSKNIIHEPTNKMSAMIDQFKQRNVSPKKIRACKIIKHVSVSESNINVVHNV